MVALTFSKNREIAFLALNLTLSNSTDILKPNINSWKKIFFTVNLNLHCFGSK